MIEVSPSASIALNTKIKAIKNTLLLSILKYEKVDTFR